MFRRILLATVVASAMGAVVVPAAAEALVRVAPPAPRMERIPEPRRGYVWSPGHWEWRRQQHVWINGSWLRERPGYAYRAPAWAQRDNRWALQPGRWDRGGRDRDRDGVTNRNDRDRDGDGVPNRRDARPNNPNLR